MRTLRSRLLGAAAVTAVLVVTACGGGPEATDDEPSAAPSSSGTATSPAGGPTQAGLDPAYAVEAPGKRTEPIGVADILVSGKTTLDPDLVEQVRELDGVVNVTTISLANVALENKVYNLAAVDPAAYRLFVPGQELPDAWKRVAAGEVAASSRLMKRLPVDEQGYLTLSPDVEGGTVHVGSYSDQPEKIDLVVNRLRGEALGMVPDNALLITTGQTAPETLKEPITELVGQDAAVQNLDAVARFGLDPDAFDTAVLVGDFADAVGVFNYTPIGGGRIAPDPAWVSSHIVTEVVPILGSVTCNKYLMPQLKAALAEVVTRGLESEINVGEYAGCYYPRYIAGSTNLSNHSFGLALDLNVPGNQRGTVGEMNREVVAIFKYWGFAWGGDWAFTDPMHFELAQLKEPG
ncbi:M15 family metallopeptidase [Nocardioides sp. C4-1]|uniref:M15 family metallopeptidase n=1 Tax=Nocardioides sp. C4-1 TaxID=3151851 RepID=UPI003264459A